MKNSMLHGPAMYNNARSQIMMRADYKHGNLLKLDIKDDKTGSRVASAYCEHTIHGYTRINDLVADYEYGKMVL
jgi:hypothetical protein